MCDTLDVIVYMRARRVVEVFYNPSLQEEI